MRGTFETRRGPRPRTRPRLSSRRPAALRYSRLDQRRHHQRPCRRPPGLFRRKEGTSIPARSPILFVVKVHEIISAGLLTALLWAAATNLARGKPDAVIVGP